MAIEDYGIVCQDMPYPNFCLGNDCFVPRRIMPTPSPIMTSPSPCHSLCWASSDIPKQIEIVCAQTRAALESAHLSSSDPISRYKVGLSNSGPWCVASNVMSYSSSRLASMAIFLIVLNISPNLVDGGTALPLTPPERALSPCGVSPGTPIACSVSAGTSDAEACLERTRTSSTGSLFFPCVLCLFHPPEYADCQ